MGTASIYLVLVECESTTITWGVRTTTRGGPKPLVWDRPSLCLPCYTWLLDRVTLEPAHECHCQCGQCQEPSTDEDRQTDRA